MIRSDKTVIKTALIYDIFVIAIFGNLKITSIKNDVLTYQKNDLLFFIACVTFIILMLQGVSGENMFFSGAYAVGNMQFSSKNEYAIIFILIALIYSGNKKINISIVYILSIFYCVRTFMYGSRIAQIELGLLLFCSRLYKKISFKAVIVLFIFFIYFMNVFAQFRNNPLIIFTNQWYKIFFIFNTSEINIQALSTNEGDVFWASERMLILLNEGYLSISDRLQSFLYYILAIVTPFSKLPKIANLSTYGLEIYSSGGGGIAPIFFYIFLSYAGVILLGNFIAKALNNYALNHELSKVYAIFLISFTPRWFAYYPIHIIKLCFYGCIIFYIFKILHKFTLKFTHI